jgi:hypothetical protein
VRIAALVSIALSGLAACGGGVSGTVPGSPATPAASAAGADDFSADASAARYHSIHHAAFGPWWGSGCPEDGACGCGDGKTLEEEFTCQMNQLAANQIPVTAYLVDGHAWSRANTDTANACSGPDCSSWCLGDDVIARLEHDGVRGLLHFWGACHDDEQYARASARLGPSLLGFYLDDGSSDDALARVSPLPRGRAHSLGVECATVTVNQGGSVARLPTEAAVDGSSQSAWFYDEPAHRIVVKVVP